MTQALAERVRIDSYLDGDGTVESMAADVLAGLSRQPRELPPKYFYDANGSKLFDMITALPEYYPTRCERAILNRHAPEMAALSGAEELVELGSGTASKTRALLYAMAGGGALRRYVPFDFDRSVLLSCAEALLELYPGLEVHGVVGDFERHLDRLPAALEGGPRLFAFLGGTIGNLYPHERHAFLSRVREAMDAQDRLLLGTDLVKDREVLEAAYNDSQGVTAEFNRNVLCVINRELGANFAPEAFEHVATFDEQRSWIEMRLRASAPQRIRIETGPLELELAEGEEIRTEISTKFTPAAVDSDLRGAGYRVERFFTDPDDLFAVTLAAPA